MPVPRKAAREAATSAARPKSKARRVLKLCVQCRKVTTYDTEVDRENLEKSVREAVTLLPKTDMYDGGLDIEPVDMGELIQDVKAQMQDFEPDAKVYLRARSLVWLG